jgi:hypothetical protein
MQYLGLAILLWILSSPFWGTSPLWVQTFRVIELKCTGNLLPDATCGQVGGVGSEIEVSINRITEHAELQIIKNSGDWFQTEVFFPYCNFVSATHWRCRDEPFSGSDDVYSEVGVWAGQYYEVTAGGPPPDYSTSGLTGLEYLAFHYGLADLGTSLKLPNWPL